MPCQANPIGGQSLPVALRHVKMAVRRRFMQTLPPRWSPTFARRTSGASAELAAILALAGGTDLISFAGGLPNPQTFPVAVLSELTARLLRGDAAVALQYSPTPGLPGLRDAFATRLAHTEGQRPEPDELMVTSGNIDALGLLAKAMLDPGDVVAVESPTYLGAIDGFRGIAADVRGIPVGEDGFDTDGLERLCRTDSPPKLVYTIPDHQNPTGITMSAERRAALVEICRRHGVLVIEDLAYRELTFTQDRPPTLWSLGPDVVVQVGTHSCAFRTCCTRSVARECSPRWTSTCQPVSPGPVRAADSSSGSAGPNGSTPSTSPARPATPGSRLCPGGPFIRTARVATRCASPTAWPATTTSTRVSRALEN
jgi:hypothetical protein